MSGELFKMLAAVDIVHVPYRGSAPMLTDLLGGQVQAAFDNLPASIEHIRAGKLRALAVTTATHSEALPDTPTVGDFVPGYEASGWFGGGKDGDGEGHPGLKVARTRCHRQRQATGGVGRFT